MRNVLFLSPHLDDAVFSCATRIRREVETGARVTVATVFSHARRRSPQWPDYVARRAEDRDALNVLGAQPRWLGLLDAPWRNPFYNSFRRIVLETAPGDEKNVATVRDVLIELVTELEPQVVYAPLAVGTHIDHRLVFAAVTSLPILSSTQFYEDRPYALVRSAVPLRMKNLGSDVPKEFRGASTSWLRETAPDEVAAFIRSFRAAPYVRRYLPPGPERKFVEAILRRQLAAGPRCPDLKLESEIECSVLADRAPVLRSHYAYRSQARSFLGSRDQFTAADRRHAEMLGVTCDRAERYWKAVCR